MEVRVVYILALFKCVLKTFIVFDLQMMWSTHPDTTIASPVSDMTSGSTALARSLTIKFEF